MKNIESWQSKSEQEMVILAIYKAIQELIESITDIKAMIVKELDLNPRDDYTNFDKLADENLITQDQNSVLKEAIGLRNRLIHHYNGIDDQRAMRSFNSIYPELQSVMEVFEKWLTKNSTK